MTQRQLNPKSKYLMLLQSSSATQLEERILQVIYKITRKDNKKSIPVKLATGVRELLIQPRPRWDDSIRDGCIQFDSSSGLFVITLNPKIYSPKSLISLNDRTGVTKRHPGFGRMRFTYAHEVAHRFFFVQRTGTWTRALDVVASQLTGTRRLYALRILHQLEERICNRIAGKILVPDDLLSSVVSEYFPEERSWCTESFARAIKRLANSFEVSRECILLRIHQAIANKVIQVEPYFCVLLLGHSDKIGKGGRSRPELRVKFSILPQVVGQLRIRPLYPGLRVENLGRDAKEFMEKALMGKLKENSRLDLPCKLCAPLNGQIRHDVSARLTGFWSKLSRSERPDESSILIWGYLSIDDLM